MFSISLNLKNSILEKLKSFSSQAESILYSQKDCSCSGACGTYVEPCGCCSYHSGKDN